MQEHYDSLDNEGKRELLLKIGETSEEAEILAQPGGHVRVEGADKPFSEISDAEQLSEVVTFVDGQRLRILKPPSEENTQSSFVAPVRYQVVITATASRTLRGYASAPPCL